MGKVWINPAFKDKIIPKRKEEVPVKKAQKTPFKGRPKRRQISPQYQETDPLLELKYLQSLMEKQITLKIKLIDGKEFIGKIKWFSLWSLGLVTNEKEIIINRLQILYYCPQEEHNITEKDLETMEEPNVVKTEIHVLQQFKDNKSHLLFHLKEGVEVKGIMDWYEKLIYHIKNTDETAEYNLYKNSVIYFEEVEK